jgi:hypothetical protein
MNIFRQRWSITNHASHHMGTMRRINSPLLETHIYRLRQKIEKDAASPAILVTEAGGYTLVP